jgi:hypothetical protein
MRNEDYGPIAANHEDICRFPKEDEKYGPVRDALAEIAMMVAKLQNSRR